jgi:hypothetical protein
MPRASNGRRYAAFEPLHEVNRETGEVLEVWYAHRALAESFGAGAGWFYWESKPGCPPDTLPIGRFSSSYLAYRDSVVSGMRLRLSVKELFFKQCRGASANFHGQRTSPARRPDHRKTNSHP